jgi:hypothetical protein
MNIMNAIKRIIKDFLRAIIIVVLLLAGLCLCVGLLMDRADTAHKMTADKLMLERVYFALCKYREAHGQWPDTIREAIQQMGNTAIVEGDAIFDSPWLYYPDAKPGTKEVLVAVPGVIRMQLLPFIGWQDAVLADGTFADFRNSMVPPARTEKHAAGTGKDKNP